MSLVRIPYRIGPIVRPNFFYGASSGSVEIDSPLVHDDVLKVIQGIPGPPGEGTQEYVQASASAVWTITHNLGRKPLIQLLTVGGVHMLGDITHLSDNVIQINFDVPLAGRAVLI